MPIAQKYPQSSTGDLANNCEKLKSELKRYDEDRLELLRNLPTGIDRAVVVYDHLAKKVSKACTIS